jgi:hypothetical protein
MKFGSNSFSGTIPSTLALRPFVSSLRIVVGDGVGQALGLCEFPLERVVRCNFNSSQA